MDSILHEKQEGSLCAQHCLNSLLQGSYYTAVELAELATQLDALERSTILPADQSSTSQNVNEEGYFSIQVISNALAVWSLELVPYLSKCAVAEQSRQQPERQKAFICNFRNHWFTIRRFGMQWFDLNSTMSKPRLISPTYLSLYLTQLMHEGHSIFIVNGHLPDCEADRIISLHPIPENYHQSADSISDPAAVSHSQDEDLGQIMNACEADLDTEDVSLQRVLQLSQLEAHEADLKRALELSTNQLMDEDSELDQAIALSLNAETTSNEPHIPTSEEIRSRRKDFLDKFNDPSKLPD